MRLRIERIELLNWDIQANQVLVLLPGVNLLTGENGSGKTSVLDGMKVALGARRIGADRSIDDYLRARGELVSMVRLVVGNPLDEATRQRPFDRLGTGFEQDQASLAVVFHATDEGYESAYHILDGDVSPLAAGVETRPFKRRSDYLARLDRLGLGRSFRTLVCTPQGEVASLCLRSPSELFDLLFDFIGGRDTLEEWERLAKDYEGWARKRDEHGRALERAVTDLSALRSRLEVHLHYLDQVHEAEVHRFALPLARRRAVRGLRAEAMGTADAALLKAREADGELERAVSERERIEEGLRAARRDADAAREQRRALGEQARAISGQLVSARVRLEGLEALRAKAAGLPVRDLAALYAEVERLRQEQGARTHEASLARERLGALDAELAAIDRGVLPPPDEVTRFREVLAREQVPHHLLFDLVEPLEPEGPARKPLESYLSELRFAVAVPDVASFARAIALAREHRFRFRVLAPDVRSRPPAGEAPLLDSVQVKEPRYEGLVVRLLRGVQLLPREHAVSDTWRDRGAAVDGDGYVLDRIGGVHQGTDRFYLGRDALARRRAAVVEERAEVVALLRDVESARSALAAEVRAAEARVEEEALRRRWEASRADHAEATAEVSRLTELGETVERDKRALEDDGERIHKQIETLRENAGALDQRAREAAAAGDQARAEAERARAEANRLLSDLDAAEEEATSVEAQLEGMDDVLRSGVEAAAEGDARVIESMLAHHRAALLRFSEADRDDNLPNNVRTRERQVSDIRRELDRLDGQVERSKGAAEQAREQYQRTTRRVFRRYFARLAEEAARIHFHTDGGLRERDDGRFEVDLKVGVGDKVPVAYSSQMLSGGEKAALSILLAMSSMERESGEAPGFFLVDEPFAASDTHKIQELGFFLERTGAQFLISMPTSMDIARCGSWLSAVLTCTKTPGGMDAEGRLRLAPPIRCSYVDTGVAE